jgi:hypothetical protein
LISPLVKTISIIEVIGGIIALLLLSVNFQSFLGQTFTIGVFIYSILLSSLSIVFGLLLFKSKKIGVYGSIAIQIFQLPHFISKTILYYFGLGVFLSVGADMPTVADSLKLSFGAEIQFGAHFMVALIEENNIPFFGINIISLSIILVLLKKQSVTKST